MSGVETIGDCVLYNADCRDVLPTLGDVDCCVSDPPYLVSKGGFAANLQLGGGFGGWMKDYGNQGDIVLCDIEFSCWLPLVYQCLTANAQVYFMTNGRNIKDMQTAAETAGFRMHTLLVWDKRAALPNKFYQNVTEFALFMFKGKARTINDPSSKNLVSIFQRDVSDHPTEKPVELMELWSRNSTKLGDTILDPFMGSGTTGVACVNLGRKFIGIESDPKHFDIACRRIAHAYTQPRLFNESKPMPVQEALPL
jgi:DNA modification methylase